MTIKQQGGIFGRNPTFNDLTVEGTLTTSGAQTMDELNVDNVNIDSNTISVTDTNGNLTLSANGTGSIRSNYDLLLGNTVANPVSGFASQTGFGWDYSNSQLQVASNVASMELGRTTSGGDGTVLVIRQANNTAAQITVAGNAGYFKPFNGGGIDFSATSGTGTSELFDDYEEGTWTPTYIAASTDFTSVSYTTGTSGRYTKIGNVVHIQASIETSAITVGGASGGVLIGGLPFTAVNNTAGSNRDGNSPISIGLAANWAGDVPITAYPQFNDTRIVLLYRTAVNGATSNIQPADLDTGASKNYLNIAGTYISA